MDAQQLLRVTSCFFHPIKVGIAGRQKTMCLGLIAHPEQRLNRFFVIIQMKVGIAQVPEILVRMERVEAHRALEQLDRALRLA